MTFTSTIRRLLTTKSQRWTANLNPYKNLCHSVYLFHASKYDFSYVSASLPTVPFIFQASILSCHLSLLLPTPLQACIEPSPLPHYPMLQVYLNESSPLLLKVKSHLHQASTNAQALTSPAICTTTPPTAVAPFYHSWVDQHHIVHQSGSPHSPSSASHLLCLAPRMLIQHFLISSIASHCSLLGHY